MAPSQRLYALYANLAGEVLEAAKFAIELRPNGTLSRAEFQYSQPYLKHPRAIPLLPGSLDLKPDIVAFACVDGGVPGFIDNLLPDTWGRKVIARSIARQLGSRQPTIADFLSHPSSSAIGCFACVDDGSPPPEFGNGIDMARLGSSWESADRLEKSQEKDTDLDVLRLAGSSGVGGARPKALVRDDRYWIAKFSRTTDDYNIVEAEHLALQIAKTAGLSAPDSRITTINKRQALLVERFDITPEGHRRHVVSVNSLLKVKDTQEDPLHASYQDIAKLVRRYSTKAKTDIEQLCGHAMLNSALNNTDDHLRNFAFLIEKDNVRLSPIYDVVPSPASGEFSQLNWNDSPYLPRLEDAARAAKELGLRGPEGVAIAERISSAVEPRVRELSQAGALPPRYRRISDDS
ncbi:MAG: type II toxin-antitoxin system HipA family toxin [Cellvibrionaceae bacterium]